MPTCNENGCDPPKTERGPRHEITSSQLYQTLQPFLSLSFHLTQSILKLHVHLIRRAQASTSAACSSTQVFSLLAHLSAGGEPAANLDSAFRLCSSFAAHVNRADFEQPRLGPNCGSDYQRRIRRFLGKNGAAYRKVQRGSRTKASRSKSCMGLQFGFRHFLQGQAGPIRSPALIALLS